LELTFSSSQSN